MARGHPDYWIDLKQLTNPGMFYLAHARAFLRTMARGHPDYGVDLNLDKTRVSFPVHVSVGGGRSGDAPAGSSGGSAGGGGVRSVQLVEGNEVTF
ncbi:hypothetical protein T484DRAFT_1835640 [Baffinella frigidus]|nr:hypothetical protein T484DRAFT_1835640 [Cryptophyta sp. CCMP2293]